MPTDLTIPGSRHWLAVMLSTEAPWFLVSFRGQDESAGFVQTVAVSWESTLAQLIESVGPLRVVSLRWVVPSRTKAGEWSMKKISELWQPADDEMANSGPLYFRVIGKTHLYDSFQAKVASPKAGRRLLVRLASPKQVGDP